MNFAKIINKITIWIEELEPLINNSIENAEDLEEFVELRDLAFMLELEEEIAFFRMLLETCNNLDKLRVFFKAQCKIREQRNNNTQLSFLVNPTSLANILYWKSMILLFRPRQFVEVLAILFPSITSTITLEALYRKDKVGAIPTADNVTIALEILPYIELIDSVNESINLRTLKHIIMANNILMDLNELATVSFTGLVDALSELSFNYPLHFAQLPQRTDAIDTLLCQVQMLQKNGKSIKKALEELIAVFRISGSRYTGKNLAAPAAMTALQQFISYKETLAQDLQEKLMLLQAQHEPTITIKAVFARFAEGENGNSCVETGYADLQKIVNNPANTVFLEQSATLNSVQLASLKNAYGINPLAVSGYPVNNNLPFIYTSKLFSHLTIESSEHFFDLLYNFPAELLPVILHHADFECDPLDAEIAKAFHDEILGEDKKAAFFSYTLRNVEKFGSLNAQTYFALNATKASAVVSFFASHPLLQINESVWLDHILKNKAVSNLLLSYLSLLPTNERISHLQKEFNSYKSILNSLKDHNEHFMSLWSMVIFPALQLLNPNERLHFLNSQSQLENSFLYLLYQKNAFAEITQLFNLIPSSELWNYLNIPLSNKYNAKQSLLQNFSLQGYRKFKKVILSAPACQGFDVNALLPCITVKVRKDYLEILNDFAIDDLQNNVAKIVVDINNLGFFTSAENAEISFTKQLKFLKIIHDKYEELNPDSKRLLFWSCFKSVDKRRLATLIEHFPYFKSLAEDPINLESALYPAWQSAYTNILSFYPIEERLSLTNHIKIFLKPFIKPGNSKFITLEPKFLLAILSVLAPLDRIKFLMQADFSIAIYTTDFITHLGKIFTQQELALLMTQKMHFTLPPHSDLNSTLAFENVYITFLTLIDRYKPEYLPTFIQSLPKPFPWQSDLLACAAQNGFLDVLELFLRCIPSEERILALGNIEKGHVFVPMMQWVDDKSKKASIQKILALLPTTDLEKILATPVGFKRIFWNFIDTHFAAIALRFTPSFIVIKQATIHQLDLQYPKLGLQRIRRNTVNEEYLRSCYGKFTNDSKDVKSNIIAVLQNLITPCGGKLSWHINRYGLPQAQKLITALKALDGNDLNAINTCLISHFKQVVVDYPGYDLSLHSIGKRLAFCNLLIDEKLKPAPSLSYHALKEGFATAFTAYNNFLDDKTKDNRGVGFGYLTYFRHGETGRVNAKAIKNSIDSQHTQDELITALIGFLDNASTRFNNHSFGTYVLDAIKPCLDIKGDQLEKLSNIELKTKVRAALVNALNCPNQNRMVSL